MPTTPVRRRLASFLSVALLASGMASTATLASPAAAAEPAAAAKAATWLAGDLTDAGTVVGSFPGEDGQDVVFTDYGRSLDSVIALLTAGGQDARIGRTLTTVSTPGAVAAYTQGAPFDKAGSAYAGATAKLAYVRTAAGADATSTGGVDLLAQLQGVIGTDGRLKDRSDFGDFANTFGQSFAILALRLNGRSTDSVVQGLLGVQCADGSFPQAFVPKAGTPCTGSVDATGLALQALAAVGQTSATPTQSAKTWLTGQQRADGSFPGEAPVNSTGYAASGLAAVGSPSTTASAYLAAQQNADGGLRRGAGAPTSDLFATAQALPALLDRAFPTTPRTVAPQPIPCATATVTLPVDTITATTKGVVTLAATSGTDVDVFAYSQPSKDYTVVRTVTVNKGGTVGVTIAPGTNTRLYAQQKGCTAGDSKVLNVRTALTLAAKRTGTRDYTFSGVALPARPGGLIVSVYRLTGDGKQVLTAQGRADATTGAFSVRKVFTGSGRFDFVVRTGQDLQNAPGSSNTRSLLVF